MQWLSIPVEVKGKYFQKINETKISDPEWGYNHWATISNSYKKALYFTDYKDIFEHIYLSNEEKLLSKVSYMFIKKICYILNIKTLLLGSESFELLEDRNERLMDICKKRDAVEYYSGPAAKSYMDEELFEKKNIKVTYFDYSGYPEYQQLYGEFEHAVTILDLIFNEGPNASKFMKSF